MARTRMLAGLFLILLWPLERSVAAQAPSYQDSGRSFAQSHFLQQTWTITDGLPHRAVTSIVQTQDGYLWLGTGGGLARFDGVKFTVFDAGNTPALKSSRILALCEDRRGALWIATETGGLTRYADGAFHNYSTNDGLPSDEVYELSEDPEGYLVIRTAAGTVRLKDGRIRRDPIYDRFHDEFPRIYAKDGSVWFGLHGSLARYKDGSLVAYKDIRVDRNATHRGVYAFLRYQRVFGFPRLHADNDGSVWLANPEGLYHFSEGRWTKINAIVIAIYQGRDGKTRFLTSRGLGRLDGGKIVIYEPKDLDVLLKANDISRVVEDREGNIWMGSSQTGLHKFREAQITTYSGENGLADQPFTTIVGDGAGGLWIGRERRLFNNAPGIYHFTDGVFIPWHLRSSASSLFRDRDGQLWTGSDEGLASFKDGKLVAEFPQIKEVRSIYQDREGALWIGTIHSQKGLYRLKDGVLSSYGTADGLVNNNVHWIVQDHEGAMWLGTEGGLGRLQGGAFSRITVEQGLSNNNVRTIFEDSDRVLWIGTFGGGLNRLRNGQVTPIRVDNSLLDSMISLLLEDEQHNFWIGGNRGIYKVSRKALNDYADGKSLSFASVVYGVGDGLKSPECTGGIQPAAWKDQGKLWFPMQTGIAVVDPARINPLPPPVMMEGMLVDKTPISTRGTLEITPGHRDLEIQYTALSLTAPEKLQFKYKLEAYDSTWVAAGTRRQAYYNNLPPGHYTFRVTASNNDGVWNETGAALAFYWRPHFYQTIWCYGLCISFSVALAGAGYRWRLRYLVRKTLVLEATVAEHA